MKRLWAELLAAFQYFTRLPLRPSSYSPDLLPGASKFLPLIGIFIGGGGVFLSSSLHGVLPPAMIALLVLTYLVLITGALHEDALADAADGFGGGWNRDKVLEIMRDSRLGSYGAIAISLSMLWRYVLIDALVGARSASPFLAAHVLCRWTALPLGFLLPAVRRDGQGITLAKQVSLAGLIVGTLIALVTTALCLGKAAWLPWLISVSITALSGYYYHRRLGGVTGDCFGATNQIVEIAVYLCGYLYR